jgi:hypothetical protein
MLELPMTAARSRFEPTVSQEHANDVSHLHRETIARRASAFER